MTGPTPRALARADNLERIKALALAQLAESGAVTLSLRAIARELNIVSSAIYRYFASRDELITALVLEAYDDLADALERAGESRRSPRRRWTDVCAVLRAWALESPHRFALIYGSAIPGYVAPPDTVAPAARVVRALARPAESATNPARRGPGRGPAAQLERSRAELGLDLDRDAMLTLVGAFARLVGLLTLELNGHFVGGFEPADALWSSLVAREADDLGL